MTLPVADTWYTSKKIDADTTLILEPHVHVLEQANMFLVEGRDRDMILDTGMGIVPLKPYLDTLRRDPGKDIICVSSHTHIDHIGCVHEFETRLVHPAEAGEMSKPTGLSTLYRDDMPASLLQTFLDAGYPPIDELLIDALPHAGYRMMICASPACLAEQGEPQIPSDLNRFRAVLFSKTGRRPWRFKNGADEQIWKPNARISVNSGQAVRVAAIAGMGVAMLPETLVRDDIGTGKLLQLLPDWTLPEQPMALIYHRDRYRPQRLTHFIDFARSVFKNQQM